VASNPRIDDLRRRLEKEPGSRLFAQLAEELRKAGDLDEAVRLSLEGLQKHPSYPSARMTLGRCLLDKGDLGGARREFESVVKSAPDNILAGRFLAESLEGLGDLKSAVQQYRAVLRLAPGDGLVAQRLAGVEARLAASPSPPAMAPVSPAPGEEGSGPSDPAPIPLVSVEGEAFELERPHEAPVRTLVEPSPQAAPVSTSGTAPGQGAEAGHGGAEMEQAAEPDIPHAPLRADVPAAHSFAGAPGEVAPSEVAPVAFDALPSAPADETPRAAVVPEAPSAPGGAPPMRRLEGEPPPPWVDPAAPRPAEPVPASAEIVSSTLAELYFSQGVLEKAVEVYRQVLVCEPGNERARARLSELEGLARPPAEPPGPAAPLGVDPQERQRDVIQRTIVKLEAMLTAVRKD
jgi:Tetratricopeptide repeat